MIDYNDFVIYKIYPKDDPTSLYIGSTVNFKRRKSQHIKNTTNRVSKKYRYPLYQYIRALGGIDKFEFEILEKFPCKTKIEGLTREKECMEIYGGKLNSIKPIK
jgi:hypothetical protein